ncbi:MAG: amidohydrolase, partial [Chitinophagaceae bacterium]|nr:amidohydrolase [Chitinophagaceae bacterium]
MRKIFIVITTCFALVANAQETVLPAKLQKGLVFIKNATIHVGNGKVIENGTIKIKDGKIEEVGANLPVPADDVSVYDVKGKHVYPGLILPTSSLGLVEISANRATTDVREIGDMNPNVRAIVAYNSDS